MRISDWSSDVCSSDLPATRWPVRRWRRSSHGGDDAWRSGPGGRLLGCGRMCSTYQATGTVRVSFILLGVGGDPRRGGGQDRGELAAIPQPPLELLLQRAAEIVADGAEAVEIGRAHVRTPVTNAQLVC